MAYITFLAALLRSHRIKPQFLPAHLQNVARRDIQTEQGPASPTSSKAADAASSADSMPASSDESVNCTQGAMPNHSAYAASPPCQCAFLPHSTRPPAGEWDARIVDDVYVEGPRGYPLPGGVHVLGGANSFSFPPFVRYGIPMARMAGGGQDGRAFAAEFAAAPQPGFATNLRRQESEPSIVEVPLKYEMCSGGSADPVDHEACPSKASGAEDFIGCLRCTVEAESAQQPSPKMDAQLDQTIPGGDQALGDKSSANESSEADDASDDVFQLAQECYPSIHSAD